MSWLEAFAQKRLAAFGGKDVDHVAADDRPQSRHRRVVQHPRLVLRDHQHDQDVVDLRQRDERGIEHRHREDPRTSERQGDAV
jgi:hypothetical protein